MSLHIMIIWFFELKNATSCFICVLHYPPLSNRVNVKGPRLRNFALQPIRPISVNGEFLVVKF